MRTALLSSLSHDLKTPLAAITGAITALRQSPDLYDAEAREELTAAIQDEAERMTSFVTNLLDMMRLEAGGIPLTLEPVDVGEVVATALQRTASVLAEHKVAVELAPDLPMLGLDAVLFEQVLVNLLDNAAKYTPGSTITISGHQQQGGGVAIRVMDDGPGLPAESLERVFDKFYRARQGDRQRAGTGWASRSAAASSRRSGVRSQPATARTDPGPSSQWCFRERCWRLLSNVREPHERSRPARLGG